MNILAIDTSSQYVSCAILTDSGIKNQKALSTGLVHSRSLLPLVEDCVESAGLSLNDIDVYACVAGPGSFTGVRIGVCAIKGLAQPENKPCVAVNTLDCLKENVPYAEYVCPIMDARRGQVYCAVYENGKLIRNYDACPIEEVAEFLNGKKTVFLGDGINVFKEKLTSLLGENALFAPEHLCYTNAAAAAVIARNSETCTPAALDAIYLRKPQAEREYESKHCQTN